jgi:hypothetical protein
MPDNSSLGYGIKSNRGFLGNGISPDNDGPKRAPVAE